MGHEKVSGILPKIINKVHNSGKSVVGLAIQCMEIPLNQIQVLKQGL